MPWFDLCIAVKNRKLKLTDKLLVTMLFKSLFVLAILALSCSTTVLRVDDDNTFRIKSGQYGYVHHYGFFDNLDLLNFSLTQQPAHFRFTSKNVLQEIATNKCVNTLTPTDRRLILTANCNEGDVWAYNSTAQLLQDLTASALPPYECFSPWANRLPPYDIHILTGLSPCDGWNRIILEADPSPQAKEEVYN
ncbi:Hypothetical predicted protein [Paramuricea clavata]|uniref:Uncharacterized protein n=1 Tax=Paramuricea clavata TaxID=317549 RepID=A0A6S7J621_PARCT|nr:Hypothetical predicted protein [Paramuricea clavata]